MESWRGRPTAPKWTSATNGGGGEERVCLPVSIGVGPPAKSIPPAAFCLVEQQRSPLRACERPVIVLAAPRERRRAALPSISLGQAGLDAE